MSLSVWPKWSLSREVLSVLGVSVRETSDMVKSGRYTSYWNAFLFLLIIHFRQDLLCHDDIGGLLWVARSDASGTPNLDENSLAHSDVRFCGRTNYDRQPGTLLRGDIDGKSKTVKV